MFSDSPLLEAISWTDAFEGSTGRGVKVCVIDSGIDNQHPAIAGAVRGWAEPILDGEGNVTISLEPHEDLFGHGTACSGIIREIAPDVELYSVRVLGRRLSGKAATFSAGLRWAIENGMQVVNLSMGATVQEYYSVFHELADEAYFKGMIWVTAANNMPIVSYPSLYATSISVACYEGDSLNEPIEFYYNPLPPVEFGSKGVDVRVAWQDDGYINATGNSFAAPHITGIVALLLEKHPELTAYQVKTVLRSLAKNVRKP
ncbi:MAG: S8 family serine peptidase [Verrucomicrobia bacterium]|nr:S8 family serine peptidase [Verrucomicrobiota bacterium]